MRTAVRAHWARIRVLFTVLVSLSILTTLVYLLSGGGLFKAKATLRTYFEDSGAMETGAEVDFQGVKIGSVSSVRLSHLNDPHRTVEVDMRVDRRFLTQIPTDSKSEIDTQNLLGDKFIEIIRGKSTTPVRDGSVLEHVPATNVYVSIDLTTFTAQLRSIDAVLKDIEQGKGSLGQFVMTDALYRDLLTGVTQVQKEIETAVGSKSTIGQLLYNPQQYEEITGSLQRLDSSLEAIQAGRGPTGEFVRNPKLYDTTRASLADIRRSLQQVGQSDFITSDQLYQDWNRKLADFMRAVDDFNAGQGAGQMVATAQPYESLTGAMKELESTLKEVRSNPRKFLHIKIF